MGDRPPVTPPFRGVSNNTSYFNTGGPFCPPEAAENVFPFDATKDRTRIGSRPGFGPAFDGALANGARCQGGGRVSRARTVNGYQLGTGTDIDGATDGSSHVQGAVAGNLWQRNSVWGLDSYAYEDVSAAGPFGDTGTGTTFSRKLDNGALSPDGTKLIVAKTYRDGSGNVVARVTCRNATTLAIIWSKKMSGVGLDRTIGGVAVSADWVFVCTNHFLRVFKLSDGSNASAIGSAHDTYGMGGWSDLAVDVKIAPDGRTLYCLFLGTSDGAVLPSGIVVTAGKYAQHFRSGIMKFAISTPAQLPVSAEVLTQVIWSPQLGNLATYYEGTPFPGISRHGYLRFSEQLPWAPRGLFPVALTLTPSGNIAVCHANAAWGPCGAVGNPGYFPPDGTAGYWNVSVFDADGVYVWKSDNDSIISEDGDGGFKNDLLAPTARCITCDKDGNIGAGGRRTLDISDADGRTFIVLDEDGNFLWDVDLGSCTLNRAAALPMSADFVVGGTRCNDWVGAGGQAQLWRLRTGTGEIIRHDDLGAVATLGLIARADDGVYQTTEKV